MERYIRKKEIKIKYPEFAYSFILTSLLCILGSGSNTFSFILLLGFIPLIFKPEFLIGPLFFSSIWSGYLLVSGGQSLARYLTFFFIFGVLVKAIQRKSKIRVDFWFTTTVVAILLGLVLSLYGSFGYTSLPVSYVLNLLLFIVAIYCPISSRKLLTNQLWSFSVLSVFYALWFMLRNGLDAFDEGKLGVLEEGVNSNSIAKGICVLAVVVLAHFLINNLKGKLIHIALILVSVFMLFLTGSRTSLVAFIITAIICILYWMRLNSKKIGWTVVILGVSLIGFYFVYDLLLDALPDLMSRFTLEDTLSDGGSGRVDVWKAYFENYFPTYWLFGMGFDPLNLFHAIEQVNGIGHGAHNIFVDILASAGVVGLLLYMSMFVKGYKESRVLIKNDVSVLIPFAMLTACLAVGIGENVLRGRLVWFALAIILMYRQVDADKKNALDEQQEEK